MVKKTIAETNNSDFSTLVTDFSNEEILVILKKRKQYQADAANFAIKEALKRGLINSEQDLFSEQFNDESQELGIFPEIADHKHKEKIRKSISRILLIVGAIPVVWGLLEIIKSNFTEGVFSVLFGTAWIYASAKIIRTVHLKMVSLLFFLLVVSVVYIVKILSEMKGLLIMDYFIPVVTFAFLVYGLLFIRRLK